LDESLLSDERAFLVFCNVAKFARFAMLQDLSQLEYRELGDEKRRHQKEEGSILGKVDRRRRRC